MYKTIISFGQSPHQSLPVYNNDPLTYCLGENPSQLFNHGSTGVLYGQHSRPCQVYLAQRCAQNWDAVCEYAYNQQAAGQRANTMFAGNNPMIGLTPSEILLKNTAEERFRVDMLNCQQRHEQFDPMNPNSPYISYYIGQHCIPIYAVNPATIDSDVVMNKCLDNPSIVHQMLINIYHTMNRQGTLPLLKGTRLGQFYGLG